MGIATLLIDVGGQPINIIYVYVLILGRCLLRCIGIYSLLFGQKFAYNKKLIVRMWRNW
jgi:hypothetical protein